MLVTVVYFVFQNFKKGTLTVWQQEPDDNRKKYGGNAFAEK
jgi:hypothetical protein